MAYYIQICYCFFFQGWTYRLDASFLEIYNEEIRDLLATEKGHKYEIKMTKDTAKDGSVCITNLRVETVTTPGEIGVLLRRARKNRAVAATNCNERSSRSHSVFQLRIAGDNSLTSGQQRAKSREISRILQKSPLFNEIFAKVTC